MNTGMGLSIRQVNLGWAAKGFCLFLLLHLLPSSLLGMTIDTRLVFTGTIVGGWLFGGLALISGGIGYWSRKVSVIEPALAGTAYLIALAFLFPKLLPLRDWLAVGAAMRRTVMVVMPLALLTVSFIVAAMSAYVGNKIWELKNPPNAV